MSRFVVKDRFYDRAKKEGFRARSAYKLQEVQKKYRLIKAGDRVLDLGCAPGSWLQVLTSLIGAHGYAVGVDLLPVARFHHKNIAVREGDIRTLDVERMLLDLNIQAFDAITCDAAPNLSGIREVDAAHVAELLEAVRGVVTRALRIGGSFLVKAFFGEEMNAVIKDLEKLFTRVSIYKPAASRGVSSEVYLVCQGKKV